MTDAKEALLQKMAPTVHSSLFPTLVTLHDVITDSPVYRSNVIHWDEQLDLLDRWLHGLSTQLKQYSEKLHRFTAETSLFCEKLALPPKMDNALIAPDFTSAVVQRFTDASQTSLALQLKVTTDTEAYFIQPMHQFVKAYIRTFKEFRKQHDKALERYEVQLQKFSSYYRTKDPSGWREEAFRLFEARKAYALMSSKHMTHMLRFRCELTNFLADQSVSAAIMQEDFDGGAQVWQTFKHTLEGWMKWLVEDRHTSSYEFQQFQTTRKKLEEEYINAIRPERDINLYTRGPVAALKEKQLTSGSKWGYMFLRVSRNSWVRKWCFLHGGYFGWASMTKSDSWPLVVLDDRLPVALYNIKQAPDCERGFCFEITAMHRQESYMFQAETQQDMLEWIAIFVKTKSSPALSSNRNSLETTYNDSTSRPLSPNKVPLKSKSTTSGAACHGLPTISDISGLVASSSFESNDATSLAKPSENVTSVVTYTSSPGEQYNVSLQHSLSLTAILVWEACNMTSEVLTKLPPLYWGIPLPLLAGMLLNAHAPSIEMTSAPIRSTDTEQILWPLPANTLDIPVADIPGYTNELEAENQTLHQLFGGVSRSEIVLDVFMGSLKRQPDTAAHPREVERTHVLTELTDDDMDTVAVLPPSSTFGYGYTGKAFVTQEALWFYSCVAIACVNTVAVKLKDVKDIYLTQENSPILGDDLVLVIELRMDEQTLTSRGPIVMKVFTEDPEMIVQKLRFVVDNAKSAEPMQLRNIYNKLRSLTDQHRQVPPYTSLAAVESPQTPPPSATKKKHKRLSFRGLGSSHPVIPVAKQMPVATPQPAPEGHELLRQASFSEPNLSRTDGTAVSPNPESSQNISVRISPPADPDDFPAHIPVPNGPTGCGCDEHLERLDAEVELPIPAKRLYELLFSDDSTGPSTDGGVWLIKTAAVLGHDLRTSAWEENEGKMQRTLKYIMPVTNPIVRMKEAEVVETQVLITKQDYLAYVVQISTKTAALPFADAFIPSVRYCITYVNKSRCKLSCYLGVKWVKYVLAKAIVTRAAMKGMSDSVAVFIPIIKDAAEELSAKVQAEREQRQAQFASDQEAALKASTADAKESSDRPKTMPPSTNLVLGMPSAVQKSLEASRALLANRFTEPTAESTVTAKTTVTTIEHRSRAYTMPARNNAITAKINGGLSATRQIIADHSLLKPSRPKDETIKTDTKQEPKEEASSSRALGGTASPEPLGHSHILQQIPKRIWVVVSVGIFIFVLWVWTTKHDIGAESSLPVHQKNTTDYKNGLQAQTLDTQPCTGALSRRAVYLRDIEEGLLRKQDLQPSYMNSESFQTFLRLKNDSPEEGPGFQWFSAEHSRAAAELDWSRDRVASMRYEVLLIFKMLNKMDSELYENEYMNWLLDSRIRCRHGKDNDNRDNSSPLYPPCQDIYKQLGTFFRGHQNPLSSL